jgi:hypothetical protein
MGDGDIADPLSGEVLVEVGGPYPCACSGRGNNTSTKGYFNKEELKADE